MRVAPGSLSAVVLLAAASPARAEETAEDVLAKWSALTAQPKCEASANTDAIVVCARRDDVESYKLPGAAPEPLLPPAEFGLFGDVRAKVTADQGGRPDGLVDQRLKVTVTIPF